MIAVVARVVANSSLTFRSSLCVEEIGPRRFSPKAQNPESLAVFYLDACVPYGKCTAEKLA